MADEDEVQFLDQQTTDDEEPEDDNMFDNFSPERGHGDYPVDTTPGSRRRIPLSRVVTSAARTPLSGHKRHHSADGSSSGLDGVPRKTICLRNDDAVDEQEPASSISVEGETIKYSVLSPKQACEFMGKAVEEANKVMQIPATTVRLLLAQLNWDQNNLFYRYFENRDKLYKDLHVMDAAAPTASSSTKPAVCEICFTTMPRKDLKGTSCGHRYCAECWCGYLTSRVSDLGCSLICKIDCPAYKCPILIDDDFVMGMIEDPVVRQKFRYGITASFVDSNRNMQRCPGVDCLYSVRADADEWMPVMCTKCNTTFCFRCAQPWHDPVECKLLKKWVKKCADDSETSNYIMANTKDCPKCKSTIEKNGGCNHMSCSKCQTQFCWVCLGQWPHGQNGSASCNVYQDDQSAHLSRTALKRYLFYYERFANHQKSIQLELRLEETIPRRMEELQRERDMSWVELDFLLKAVTSLKECRTTLMYTYAFAFYLKEGNQRCIFEDNQRDLEIKVEVLSGLLERGCADKTPVEMKQAVQDNARYCEQRREVLIRHVHEGYESYDNNHWEFIA